MIAAGYPRHSGPLEAMVAGKERKVLMDTGRALKLARTRVDAEEREVSAIEQLLKEARRRLTLNQERSAHAAVEERDALVRKRNACQDLRRQKNKLWEARGKEGGHEAQRIRKAER